ncbi:hypothetical protein A2U01_0113762, partial [Trifolium medium]|nr:hypothetical protein [Trifolium medium]
MRGFNSRDGGGTDDSLPQLERGE